MKKKIFMFFFWFMIICTSCQSVKIDSSSTEVMSEESQMENWQSTGDRTGEVKLQNPKVLDKLLEQMVIYEFNQNLQRYEDEHQGETAEHTDTENRVSMKNLHITNAEDLGKVYEELAQAPEAGIRLEIETKGLDIQKLEDALKLCYEKNKVNEQYIIEVFCTWDESDETANHPVFIQWKQIEGLDVCTYALYSEQDKEYYVILEGEWEGVEVSQHLVIPSTGYIERVSRSAYRDFDITKADINFDKTEDLLIQEGHGHLVGFYAYRAIVWDREKESFVWYSSFPDWLTDLDFDNQRVIYGGENSVLVYEVVKGEYVETKKYRWDDYFGSNETEITGVFSYYEMGVLSKEYDMSQITQEEIQELYPDLRYRFVRKG